LYDIVNNWYVKNFKASKILVIPEDIKKSHIYWLFKSNMC